MVMTARTSFPATYIFTFISNLMPAYYFSKYVLCCAVTVL